MISHRWILTILGLVLFTSIGATQEVSTLNTPSKNKRPLNITLFDKAIKSLSTDRINELNNALIMANIPQIQNLFQSDFVTLGTFLLRWIILFFFTPFLIELSVLLYERIACYRKHDIGNLRYLPIHLHFNRFKNLRCV